MRKIVKRPLGFEDNKTGDFIMCSFSLKDVCKPDCAACSILNEERTDLLDTAICKRDGERVFTIGFVTS